MYVRHTGPQLLSSRADLTVGVAADCMSRPVGRVILLSCCALLQAKAFFLGPLTRSTWAGRAAISRAAPVAGGSSSIGKGNWSARSSMSSTAGTPTSSSDPSSSRGASNSVGARAPPKCWSGLREVVDLYDCFLIDQWGVMHDGHRAYPGALECMQELVKAGKSIVLLSNSSKRKASSFQRLREMGFEPGRYTDIITSGELAYLGLEQPRDKEPFASQVKGNRVLVFGNDDDDAEYLSSLGCVASTVDEADFLLARGPFLIMDGPGQVHRFDDRCNPLHTSTDFYDIATKAIQRSVPLVVANPDVIRPGGSNDPMPGLLGQAYEARGGTVLYVGKPYPLVYQAATTGVSSSRVCCVGDSMMNDILGAHWQGLESVLITDGIHAQALGVGQGTGQQVDAQALQDFLRGFDYAPSHVLPRFKW